MIYNWHIKIFRNVENYSVDSDADTSGKNKENERKSNFKGKQNLIQNNNKTKNYWKKWIRSCNIYAWYSLKIQEVQLIKLEGK